MRALYVASRVAHVWGPIGRLDYEGGLYRFCYTRGARQLSGFRPLTGMDDFEQVYESEDLFPVFSNRLLSPSRPEYEAYLHWGGFDPGHPPDPIALLGVTEGVRQTDSIEVFPCPTPDAGGGYSNKFFLHGITWMAPAASDRIARLEAEEQLHVMLDPCNPADPNAVAVRTDSERTMIGYIPRYLARDVSRLLKQSDPQLIHLVVDRVNRDAPLQHRLLCRMRACWPENFQPFSDEVFRPIPEDVPASYQA
ncbi:MAG: HIRAN domain-containing protein [Thermoguttaceae bacterium]|jgi:hypothetical protein